ncbi:MAG: FMN-binding protein [Anaerolineales bacterium]
MANYRSNTNSSGGFVSKLFLTAFVALSFVAYVLHEHFTTPAQANSSNNNGAPFPSNGAQTANVSSGGGISGGPYKDGTYTGSQADAYYGMVQVQATIQSGKITGVNFLEYPNHRRTSQQINDQVMPWLQQEAIQAQSAQVDLISGATLTSQAFATSLQAALNAARN